jgi:phosphatidylserine/phosphatidylglycerophosphate/cardiolipin synthase-like enzyme
MTKMSKNELEKKLLWSKPIALKVPFKIAKEFRYLNNYIFNLICSAKARIILFSPYYSGAGMDQLIISIDNLIKANNGVKIDIIVNDIEAKFNKKAMEVVSKLVEDNINYNSLRIFKSNFKNEKSTLFFHAKLLLVDNTSGYMGSANFSKRGLTEQLEIGIQLSKENTKTLVELIDYLINEGFLSEAKV